MNEKAAEIIELSTVLKEIIKRKGLGAEKMNVEIAKRILERKINVICFDFGHGESTAASGILGENDSITDFSLDSVKNTYYKTPTYLCIGRADPENDVRFGDDAAQQMQSVDQKNPEYIFYQSFKPLLGVDFDSQIKGNETKAKLSALYIKSYLQAIFSVPNNHLDLNRPTLLVLGHPSGKAWEEAEEVYKNIFRQIEFEVDGKKSKLYDVISFSESFAAMASCLKNRQVRFNDKKSFICIDLGSSTADITCIKGGKIIYENGINLGAHLIEENIFADNELENRVVNQEYTMCQLRTLKELYFGSFNNDNKNARTLIDLSDGNTVVIQPKEDGINKACGGMSIKIEKLNQFPKKYESWISACKEFFFDSKKEIAEIVGGESNISTVILTGGPTRMPFVRSIADEVFGEEKIELSKEPSYTVSHGLALIINKMAKASIKLAEYYDSLASRYEMMNAYNNFCDKVSGILATAMFNKFSYYADNWEDGESANDIVLKTDNSINSSLADRNSNLVGDIKKAIKTDLDETFVSLLSDAKNSLKSIICKEAIPTGNISIPNEVLNVLINELSNINVSIKSYNQWSVKLGANQYGWFEMDYKRYKTKLDHGWDLIKNIQPRIPQRKEAITESLYTLINGQLKNNGDIKASYVSTMVNSMKNVLSKVADNISLYAF